MHRHRLPCRRAIHPEEDTAAHRRHRGRPLAKARRCRTTGRIRPTRRSPTARALVRRRGTAPPATRIAPRTSSGTPRRSARRRSRRHPSSTTREHPVDPALLAPANRRVRGAHHPEMDSTATLGEEPDLVRVRVWLRQLQVAGRDTMRDRHVMEHHPGIAHDSTKRSSTTYTVTRLSPRALVHRVAGSGAANGASTAWRFRPRGYPLTTCCYSWSGGTLSSFTSIRS